MPTTFTHAPEVEKIARDCISKWHPSLEQAPIRYVFRSQATKNRGKYVLGRARKVSNLNAYLALGGIDEPEPDEPPTPFFVIEIAFDAWEILEKEQRVALVDHELCHCMMDEDSGKLIMHPHDLEEFNAVVRRHGLWQPDVVTFARTLREAEQRNAQRAVEE